MTWCEIYGGWIVFISVAISVVGIVVVQMGFLDRKGS